MIHLYKKISSNRNLKYRVRSGAVEAHKDGSYHVVILDEGNPLIKQLKAIHGFTERKEIQTYNAIRDIKKDAQEIKRSIVDSAKKVKKIIKKEEPKKTKRSKKKKSSSLSQKNTKF